MREDLLLRTLARALEGLEREPEILLREAEFVAARGAVEMAKRAPFDPTNERIGGWEAGKTFDL